MSYDDKVEESIPIEGLSPQQAEVLLMKLLNRSTEENSEETELIRMVKAFVETPVDFQPGDMVRWKSGLKNKRLPAEKQPAIVIHQLSEPLIADKDSGTPYFQEPLNLVLAFTSKEGELVTFYYDKRRFERIKSNGAKFPPETIERLSKFSKPNAKTSNI